LICAKAMIILSNFNRVSTDRPAYYWSISLDCVFSGVPLLCEQWMKHCRHGSGTHMIETGSQYQG